MKIENLWFENDGYYFGLANGKPFSIDFASLLGNWLTREYTEEEWNRDDELWNRWCDATDCLPMTEAEALELQKGILEVLPPDSWMKKHTESFIKSVEEEGATYEYRHIL